MKNNYTLLKLLVCPMISQISINDQACLCIGFYAVTHRRKQDKQKTFNNGGTFPGGILNGCDVAVCDTNLALYCISHLCLPLTLSGFR